MKCEYCGSDISPENFEIHSGICMKNKVICTKCQKYFPKNQLEGHLLSHELRKCPNCKFEFDEEGLLLHDCSNPICECEFCKISIPLNQLTEHTDYCGSRTELCEKCKKFVKKKEWKAHQLSGHLPKQPLLQMNYPGDDLSLFSSIFNQLVDNSINLIANDQAIPLSGENLHPLLQSAENKIQTQVYFFPNIHNIQRPNNSVNSSPNVQIFLNPPPPFVNNSPVNPNVQIVPNPAFVNNPANPSPNVQIVPNPPLAFVNAPLTKRRYGSTSVVASSNHNIMIRNKTKNYVFSYY